MHHLHINMAHEGRDNVGGVVINGEPIDLTGHMELALYQLCQSCVTLAGLNLEDTEPLFSRETSRPVLDEWTESDKRHNEYRVDNVDYIDIIANARIAFRNSRTGSRGE
jgi:hypothetical protein